MILQYEAKDGMKLPPEFYKLAKMDYEKVLKKLSPAYIESVAKKAIEQKNNVGNEYKPEVHNAELSNNEDATDGEIILEEADNSVEGN